MTDFFERCKPHINNLLDIVNSIGRPMEGSLFFGDQILNAKVDQISEKSLIKCGTLVELVKDKKSLLEIGFNSGFSSLVFLLANENVRVTSIDTFFYPYTKPCFEYLKQSFGDRIDIVKGMSSNAMPNIFLNNTDFDAYFVDGGHNIPDCTSDLSLIFANSKPGAIVCVDDYDQFIIKTVVDSFVGSSKFVVIQERQDNIFLKVNK